VTCVCCHTADHGPDCQCWRCIAVVLDNELDAMEWAAALPELKPVAKSKMKPKPEAPEVVLDALSWAWRERGRAAFDEPMNRSRLADLSPRQRKQLRVRLERLKRLVAA
jgi:hypothetical protein